MISLEVFIAFYVFCVFLLAGCIFYSNYKMIPLIVITTVGIITVQISERGGIYAEDIGNSQYIKCIEGKKFIVGENSNTLVPESGICIDRTYTYEEASRYESKSFIKIN